MADDTLIDHNYEKTTASDLPDWFDEELFRRGQAYYNKNVLSIHVAYLTGLMAVFIVPTIAKILTFTKQSSTPCLAYKRYLQTVLHVVQLHDYDIKDSKSKFYKSLNTIRWKHSTASKRSNGSIKSGITQKDMVLTQFGFVGYVLLKSQELGFTNDIEDREAFNHFWRVIGHLLGIPERLNLCRKNELETTMLCRQILDNVISKTLKDPAAEFYFLTDIAIQGFRAIDITLDTDTFYEIFYELHGMKYPKQTSYYSKAMYVYRKAIIASFTTPVVGPLSRFLWNKYVKCLNWISEHLPVIAWLKYGINQSRINLYPHSAI